MKFQQVQQDFVAYLRSPEQSKKPADVAQQRLDVYRELLFNNVSGFVSSAFPVLKSLYKEHAWQQRLQLFFAGYSCENPFFLSIAGSFLDILQNQYQLQPEVIAEADDMAMLRLLARDSGGLAVIPEVVVKDELQNGRLAKYLTLPQVYENFYIITTQRELLHPQLNQLLQAFSRQQT